MLVGVLPGIGPTEATALLIPLTYGMSPVSAIFACGIYYGGMYGGTITSVLINTPGEALRCHLPGRLPAGKTGQSRRRIESRCLWIFCRRYPFNIWIGSAAPPLADWALKFGPSECSRCLSSVCVWLSV
jgi:putative tricarboxylic transport membrane protein